MSYLCRVLFVSVLRNMQMYAEAERVGRTYMKRRLLDALCPGSSKSRKLENSIRSKATVDVLGICIR